jgi:hypothetical protein
VAPGGGQRQDVGEGDAGPRRSPRRARAPRRLAVDVADGHQAGPPVARALQRRRHLALAEGLAQRRERELERALDGAVDAQAPGGGVDLRHVAVPAHVEGVGGGQCALGQRGEPGLGVERLLLVHDEVGALSVPIHGRNVEPAAAVHRGRVGDGAELPRAARREPTLDGRYV